MKNWREVLFVGIISFIIGSIVASPIIAIEKGEWLANLLNSGLVGLAIGIAARYAFMYFYKNVKSKTFLSFIAVQLVIGLGTYTGAYILGVRKALYFFMMIFPAEIVGFISAILMYHYNVKLNKGLRDTQEKYKT
jgi:hypothetical protein